MLSRPGLTTPAAACASLLVAAGAAFGQFAEPNVTVLHTLNSDGGSGSYGWAVADLSDIDGDGVKEVLTGAPYDSSNGMFSGLLTVHSGATGALLHTFIGAPAELLGYSMADAGDVDADGVADIIVGAVGFNSGNGHGRVYIYSGADWQVIHDLEGEAFQDVFGRAVAGLGDVNGDGHSDVLIGASGNDANGNLAGRAYVYSGIDGSVLRVIDGEASGARLGAGAAGAGDIDGDGVGDMIIGSPGVSKALVLSGATGDPIFPALEGAATAGAFGDFFVAGCGDVDADGVLDLYVGDYADSAAGGGAGRAYVFSGADGSLLHDWQGAGPGEGLGCGRGAGDVDGDGHADLIVGAYTSSVYASGAGRAFVYSGADGGVLRVLTNINASYNCGFDAVGLGDVNGDGLADYVIAAATGDTVYIVAGAAPLTADLDGDGDVDGADLALLLGQWGASGSTADLTGDGVVDGADLALLLGQWS